MLGISNRGPQSNSDDPVEAFLGVGWAFPLAVAPDGTVVTAAYDEDVRQAILIILGTNRGERVMRPDFGAGLRDFVFAAMSSATLALVKQRVSDALIDEEPRIDVIAVDVTADTAGAARLLIDVSYQVRATNTRANLVYPFYLDEGTPP
jgi:phage baseplate assembly protein W